MPASPRTAFLLVLLVGVAPACAFPQTGAPNQPAGSTTSPPAAGNAAAKGALPVAAQSAATPANGADFTPEQIRQLIQTVTDHDQANDKEQRDYTYLEREEDRHLDGKGQVKSTESTTSEVMMIYGDQVEKRIAKNDKPLSPKDAAKEDAKIQKIIDKRKNESEHDRRKRQAKEEKDREEGRQWVGEISDAFDFRMVGTETIAGRESYVIDGTPRPGFHPHMKYANYLPKFRFRVWIDKADLEVTRLDAEALDNISWGLFLARLRKGAHFLYEQTRVNNEVWLPKHFAMRISARVLLLKNFNVEVDTTYSDYQKFRTHTKILGIVGAAR